MRRHACAKAWQERQDVLITRMGALRAGRNAAIGKVVGVEPRCCYQRASYGREVALSYSIVIANTSQCPSGE